jgi:hypothetical protein
MHYILCILYTFLKKSFLLRGAAKSPAAETMEPAGGPPACPGPGGGAIAGAGGLGAGIMHITIW